MRESLNLAAAGIEICNGRSAAGYRSRVIRDRALLCERGVSFHKDNKAGALIRGEAVRIEYCVADATTAGIGVTVL